MKVVIVGCGRVGARVAMLLDHAGHDVSVVDTESRAFRRLAASFSGNTVIGTGIDEDILRAAGIENADAFVAVTNGDNRNIMAAQVARHIFNVETVVCRIYDPVREDAYRRLGLVTVCPTATIAAQVLEHVLSAASGSGVTEGLEG